MSITRNATECLAREQAKPSTLQEKDEIEQLAESRLRRAGYPELRDVRCGFFEGVLILRGRVPSFYVKQVAQSLLLHLGGVEELDNRLEVVSTSACP